jgi:hypothetical protein
LEVTSSLAFSSFSISTYLDKIWIHFQKQNLENLIKYTLYLSNHFNLIST